MWVIVLLLILFFVWRNSNAAAQVQQVPPVLLAPSCKATAGDSFNIGCAIAAGVPENCHSAIAPPPIPTHITLPIAPPPIAIQQPQPIPISTVTPPKPIAPPAPVTVPQPILQRIINPVPRAPIAPIRRTPIAVSVLPSPATAFCGGGSFGYGQCGGGGGNCFEEGGVASRRMVF